jgi:signal transduction histidine kinase
VYNIVTLRLGGRVRLESTEGRGTSFKIRLPVVAPKDNYVEPARVVTMTQ